MKKIAVIFYGGSMSHYIDSSTNSQMRIKKFGDLYPLLSHFPQDVSVDIFTEINTKKFFLVCEDWKILYDFIFQKADQYDGFVVVQESDSILFGSCIISYMVSGFYKPIIFTGSPTPFFSKFGSTAENNLLGALRFASADLGETGVFTRGKLVRAVRAKRQNIEEQYTVISSFIDDLGNIDLDGNLHLGIHRIRRSEEGHTFSYKYPNKRSLFLKMYPGMDAKILENVTGNTYDSLVVESLGYGSVPPYFLKVLYEIADLGIPIVLIAEHDSPIRTFPMDADQEFNHDMMVVLKGITSYAALVKSSFVLENFPGQFKEKMLTAFCGGGVN